MRLPSLRLRTVLVTALFSATTFFVGLVPSDVPLPRPEALAPRPVAALGCATTPEFTGWLTGSSSSTTAISRTTTGNVFGYISPVGRAWSCTSAYRYDGLGWARDGDPDGNFDWGNLINSTSVACNWGVGSTDYLKANSTTDCPDSDAEYAMPIYLEWTQTNHELLETVFHNDITPDEAGDFMFIHSDCTSYYSSGGGEMVRYNHPFTTTDVGNRPGANCDPLDIDGTSTTQAIVVDGTAPSGTSIVIASGAASTANNLVSIDLAATDNVSGVAQMRFSNNGSTWSAWEAYATTRANWDMTSATYGGTGSDGTKTVSVQFQDANGNGPSTALSDTILLDRTAPSGTISISSAATYTTTASVTLTLSATDSLSTVSQMRFSNNGSTWSAYETYATTRAGWDLTSATYGGSSSEGTKPVYVQFKDSPGNANSGTGISDTIIYDASPADPSPPDVTCTGTGVYQSALNGACFFRPAAASTLTITAGASDGVSGIDYLRFLNLTPATNWTPSPALPNDDPTPPFTEALTFNASTGSSAIDVFARNGAGLNGSTRTVSLTVDSTPPSAILAYPEANRSLAGDVAITGTATDSQTFKEYQLEYGAGSSPSSWTSIGTFTSQVIGPGGALGTWSTGALTGVYTLRLTVRDGVGNTSATASSLVYLENTRRGDEAFLSRIPFELGGGYTLDIGVANGEARLSRDLFSIPSYGPPQELGLTYSSLETGTTGTFGAGWTSNLTQYLTFESGFVVWHRADGGRVPFGLVGSTWTALRGHFETLGTGTGVYTITLKDQTKLTFENSGGGRLTKVENRFGKALTLVWGTSSATATDASGRATTMAIDSANNRITGATDSAGRAWSFGYTGTDLTTITDPASKVTTLAYASHLLTSVTRSRSRVSGGPESVVWGIAYTAGKATSVTDPVNASVANTFTYNPTATVVGLLKTYSPVRNTSTHTFDALGRVTSVVDPEGFTTSSTFDADSNVLTHVRPITSSTSATTTYTYDARGNVLTEIAPIDASTTVTTVNSYSTTNDLLTRSEADTDSAIKLVTRYTYDGAGHRTSVDVNCTTSGTTPPATASSCTGAGTQDATTNLITSYAYTSNDQLQFEQDPLGRVTKHVYDTHGNETSTIGDCTTTGTTLPSPFTSCTGGGTPDFQTNVTSASTFDPVLTAGKAGLPTKTTDPLGRDTTFTYDALGRQLTEVLSGDSSIPALTRTTTYDEFGNTLTEADSWTPPGGSLISRTTSHVYDLADRETSVTDPAGVVTTTAYDAAGDPTTTTIDGVNTTRGFDGLGRAITETVDSNTTTHSYDAQGNETATTYPAGKTTSRLFDLAGRLLSETVDDGGLELTSAHAYDRLGREITMTDPEGVTTTTTYDRAGRATRSIVGGTTTDTAYDRLGNVVTLTGPYPNGGSAGPVEKDVFDPLNRATDRIANYVSGSSDPAANLTTTTFYDAVGSTVAVRDPKGITSRTISNARDLAATQISNCADSGTVPTSSPRNCIAGGTHDAATNITATMTYDGRGANLATVRDTIGADDVRTQQTYDEAGRLTKVIVDEGTGKLNLTSEYAYDSTGRQTASKDPRGTITRTFFNAVGKVDHTIVNCTEDTTSPQPPVSSWWTCHGSTLLDGTWNVTTSYDYDGRGNRTKETAPNGRITTLSYDGADRLIKRIDNDVASPSGPSEDVTTEYAYDDAGRQVAALLPASNGSTATVTAFTYDALGRLTSEIHNCTVSGTSTPGDPAWRSCAGTGTADQQTNVVTAYTYDAQGNRLSIVAPDPAATGAATGTTTTRYAFDPSNRLCRVLEAATVDLQALADPCTTPVSGTSTINLSTRYAYDANGNVTSMIDALVQMTAHSYDASSRPLSTTDALGRTVVWAYDDAGHRIRQENRSDPPFTNSIAWTYDGAGRILTRVADGLTTTYTYDANGNKLTASDGTFTITSTYDRLNRVLTVDDEDAGTTPDTSYTYSLASPSWTDPTGTYTATLDKFDRSIAINDPANASDFTTAYAADGQPATQVQPNGNTTGLTYDKLGRLSTKNTTAAGPVNRALYTWTYNRAGQVLTEASTITGDPANGTVTYADDPLARLSSATLSATTTTYGWDKVPNRTSVKVGAGTAATTSFDAANRPTSGANPSATYTSDADGRLTARPGQTLTWDHLGRLTAVKNAAGTITIAAYTYDPVDRLRMVDYGAGVRTRFRYVGLTTSAAQLIDDAAGTVTRNIGNGWTGERLLDWTGTNSNIRIYGTNAHHDVTWLASSTGTVSQALRYDPWGNPRSSVPIGYTPFRFQGSFYDDTTTLSWVVSRWYAPALGTFISEDSLLGEPREPDSRHLYAYGEGDPVGRWDPDGHDDRPAFATRTFPNRAGYKGKLEIGLFIAAQYQMVPGGIRTYGDNRGFSSWHVNCRDARGCIIVDFDRHEVRMQVNATCTDFNLGWPFGYAFKGCNSAFAIQNFGSCGGWLNDRCNLLSVKETSQNVLNIRWDITQSRLPIIRPDLTVNGFLSVEPGTSARGPRIRYDGEGFPSEEAYHFRTGFPRRALFQHREGAFWAMLDWWGDWHMTADWRRLS